MRKRKKHEQEHEAKAHSTTPDVATPMPTKVEEDPADREAPKEGAKPVKRAPMSKARDIRLEQNRKAARESRRRKKVMIEELQRSVIFFSRANGTLKQQNDELARLLMQAQVQVSAIENQQQGAAGQQGQAQVLNNQVKTEGEQRQQQQGNFQLAQAQAVATQAMYESQGFPAAAARAAAHTMIAGSDTNSHQPDAPTPVSTQHNLPPMQPGATMQAMANFQQAAAAAMQAAVQGMQGIPGLSLSSLAAAPAGANPQQAFNDTMTALAMQQAAAAAATGQQFFQNPYMAHPMMAWQNQQAAAAAAGAVQQVPAGQHMVQQTQQQQGTAQQQPALQAGQP
jgi:hypothetical protein